MIVRSQSLACCVARMRLTCEARFVRSVPAAAASISVVSGGWSVRKNDSCDASSASVR